MSATTNPFTKTLVTIDIAPWNADTDIETLKSAVLAITHESLVWGHSKFVDIGYGIKKVQQSLVI